VLLDGLTLKATQELAVRRRGPRWPEWGELTGFARAAMPHRLGDLVSANAERLARLEVNDSGKLYREILSRLNAIGGWSHYNAGFADKIEGWQIPSPNPNFLVHTRRDPVGEVAPALACTRSTNTLRRRRSGSS
jgi:acyl-CoA reductase-like NAD-dependent aldehyde dehydrogenase